MKTASKHPIDITCGFCGNTGFKEVLHARKPSYFCGSCGRKYLRKKQEGSGQIAGPVYHRTQEL